MHWFDILALGLLLIMVVYSAIRGFLKESVVAAAWAAGYFGSLAAQPLVAPLFRWVLKTSVLANLASFFFAFIFLYVAVRLAGYLLIKNIKVKNTPASFNHGAGAVIGGVKWVFLMAIFLSPLSLFPDVKAKLMHKSVTAESVMKLSQNVTAMITTGIKDAPELKKKLKHVSKDAKTRLENSVKSLDDMIEKVEPGKIRAPEKKTDKLTEKDKKEMDIFIEKLK